MFSVNRSSGATGTAAVRAVEKTLQSRTQDQQREARIQELKKQYESGQYEIDSIELSATILDHLLKNQI